MLVSLTHLPVDGLRFEHQYEEGKLDLSGHEFEFRQLPLITGRVSTIGMETRVKGTIRAQLETVCDRCLESVLIPVNQEFDLFYLPEAQASKSDEKELQERDLDFSFYRDETIDIDELVLEQLELSLPSRILCREDCLGLCSQCGTNLNLEKCQCQPPIDPRWQVLADLKNK